MALGTEKKLLTLALTAALLVGCGGAEERKAKYLERGKSFIAEENWDKARVEIKNVLQIDPKSAEAYYLLGQVEEKKQEWSKAFGNYAKAAELDPELIDARSRLAQFYMLQANAYKAREDRDGEAKALGQAQTEVDEVLKRNPKHSDARSLRASMLMREGKNDEALQMATAILKDDPANGPAATLLAGLHEQAGRTAEAEKVLVEAAGNVKESTPIRLRLAQLYIGQKKNDAAEAVLREIVAMHPDQLGYRVQLAQFLAQSDQADKAEAVMREAVAADPDDGKRYLMLADLLLIKKGAPAATEYLNGAIAAKPELSDLQLGLARIHEKEGKPDEAKKVYRDMIARYGEEPAALTARNRLAAQAAAEGDYDTAGKLVSEVLAKNPRDSEALTMKGRLSMRKSDWDTAITSFRSVLKDQPDSVAVLHLLAETQLRKGDVELAGDNLRRAVELEPNNTDARVKFARYLITRKDLASALEQVDIALERDPSNADAIAAKSEVLAVKGDLAAVKEQLNKLKQASPENPEASLRLARVHMAESNIPGALAEVDSVLARDAGNMAALILKTDILIVAKDEENLVATIKQMQTAAPENPEGYFRMGRYLRSKGDNAAAMQEYEKALSLAKGDAKSAMLNEIVHAQIAAGQADQALARIEAVLREDPQHTTANGLLGSVQFARKDYKAAEAAFLKQASATPNSAVVYGQLAAVREQQGDSVGAAAAFQQGLGVLKDEISLLVGLAGVHERTGKFDEAIALYEQVLTKQSDNAIAVNNLASLLVDHRTDEKSIMRAKELAAKLEPVQQPAMRDTLGWVHYRSGDYAKAVEVLEGVVNAAPKVAVFQYHLGMAYAKAGDKDKARATLSKALELGDFAEAEDARKALAML